MEVVIQPDADAVASVRRRCDRAARVARSPTRCSAWRRAARRSVCTPSSFAGIVPERSSFRRATAFLLDEYIGLPAGHPESYRAFIERHFTGLVDIDPRERPRSRRCGRRTSKRRALDYEAKIRAAGGVDLQLLGIGADGHLGFNEPTSSLASRTRVKTLTEQTRNDNNRFFGDLDEVPRHVRHAGDRHDPGRAPPGADRHRRRPRRSRSPAPSRDPLTSMCPASAIQLHPHATVVIDEAAAAAADAGRLLPRDVRCKATVAVDLTSLITF